MLSASKLCVLNLGANDLLDQGLIQLISALGMSTCRLQELRFTLFLTHTDAGMQAQAQVPFLMGFITKIQTLHRTQKGTTA